MRLRNYELLGGGLPDCEAEAELENFADHLLNG